MASPATVPHHTSSYFPPESYLSGSHSPLRLLVVGDPCVGKSSLINHYSDYAFPSIYFPTSTISIVQVTQRIKKTIIEGNWTSVQLWDVPGAGGLQGVWQEYYGGVDGVMVVYDVCKGGSWTHVGTWVDEIRTTFAGMDGVLVVGNKIDLSCERQISFEEGKQTADELGVIFMETSAVNLYRVESVFAVLASVALSERRKSIERSMKNTAF